MNIFLVHPDPVIAASMLCDQHVTKMVTESIQMLSTAHHVAGEGRVPSVACLPTHANHPCNIWIRESTENYRWLWRHAHALAIMATSRYGAGSSQAVIRLGGLLKPPVGVPNGCLTPLAPAINEREPGVPPEYLRAWRMDAILPPQGDMFPSVEIQMEAVAAAYRQFYIQVKSTFARWTGSAPAWYVQGLRQYGLMHRLRERQPGTSWPKGLTKPDTSMSFRAHPTLSDYRQLIKEDSHG